MKVILYRPQIPQNTGNIVRTCAVTGCELIIVNPGFSTSDKWLKRAGLDYWEGVDVSVIDDLETYLETCAHPFYFFSSKAPRIYSSEEYSAEAGLIFGSESEGLPSHFHERWPSLFVKVPMIPGARCLNLATTVGIAIYEARRQQGWMSQ